MKEVTDEFGRHFATSDVMLTDIEAVHRAMRHYQRVRSSLRNLSLRFSENKIGSTTWRVEYSRLKRSEYRAERRVAVAMCQLFKYSNHGELDGIGEAFKVFALLKEADKEKARLDRMQTREAETQANSRSLPTRKRVKSKKEAAA